MRLDATGKVSLDHLYTGTDPRPFFTTLRPLGYCVPQQAKPHFAKLLTEYRDAHGVAAPRVLDVGCSYGVNGALLKYDVTMDELYARYCDVPQPDTRTRADLIAHDRELARSRQPARPLHVTGLDVSAGALEYALDAGFLDDAVHADLEAEEPTAHQRRQLAGTDLVVSTGCLGYVTERTLVRIVRAQGEHRPWMAHFVLRMFSFAPIAAALADLGYHTYRVEGVFPQRRFASPEEHARVVAKLTAAKVNPDGLEAEGWLHAELYVSTPRTSPAHPGPSHPSAAADIPK
ncbi:class I SAM-dependent methyltransferase [Streptomyces sp. JJ66]|uniref:class I SAM-dependent methyltransferase n=1 Tax=Streptomyces sp. JJ66 TaxID=2803843 RepID=UPI001C55D642|nr:class I SAM-dependent methyltransferase [Streptomyces sp. JJ66]MBW1602028.1 class I SAM-dependent methyltransferase [Streptomyces sp. JJ66]